jgi:hypothetical protein
MSEPSGYQVLPLQPKLSPLPQAESVPLTIVELQGVVGLGGGTGCFLWVVMCVLIWFASGSGVAGVLLASIVVAVAAKWMHDARVAVLEREKAVRVKQEAEAANAGASFRVQSEATALTAELNRVYRSSSILVHELPRQLDAVAHSVRRAEIEFSENAFAPFWDAVEAAAQHLAVFIDHTNQLSRGAAAYYTSLEGRKHTFPIFPAHASTLPDPAHAVAELRRLVRMGQTNFQFATIWEHRRTREVLIAGFRTLGEAVGNLGVAVQSSVGDLRRSIASSAATVVQEEIRTRETLEQRLIEQNRLLESIERRSSPSQ